jgi:C-terminal processing protease CtpA/Prc
MKSIRPAVHTLMVTLPLVMTTFPAIPTPTPVTVTSTPIPSQALDSTDRARARQMLGTIKEAIQNHYFDKSFRGIDLDAHFKAAAAKLETAVSLGHAYSVIAQALVDFGDSHTFFIPPARSATYEFGWEMRIIGDRCFVVAVKPGSDAEAKGLKAGDQLLRIDAFTPTRDTLWLARYLYYTLSPRSALTIVAQRPGEEPRTLSIAAKVTPGPKTVMINVDDIIEGVPRGRDNASFVRRSRMGRVGDITIWKLAGFDLDTQAIDKFADEALKGTTSLILDLRGNPGGDSQVLERLTSRFFDKELKLGDLKGRRSMRGPVARKRNSPFAGRLIVLIDAESASAAEVFARVIQLESRGLVFGDRSSGSVMMSRQLVSAVESLDGVIMYGMSVTEADLIMADGKSLERVGVVPDQVMMPTPLDLQSGKDPVLAQAVTALGGTLDAAAAAKMFPPEWK